MSTFFHKQPFDRNTSRVKQLDTFQTSFLGFQDSMLDLYIQKVNVGHSLEWQTDRASANHKIMNIAVINIGNTADKVAVSMPFPTANHCKKAKCNICMCIDIYIYIYIYIHIYTYIYIKQFRSVTGDHHPINPAIFPPSRQLERTASAPARRGGRSRRILGIRRIAWSHCVRTCKAWGFNPKIPIEIVDFPIKNGDIPIKKCDFPYKKM